MKNDNIEETQSEQRISTDSLSSFNEFPFQLIDQNYYEKIEFIKSSLHGIGQNQESSHECEEISQREFNSNLASLQSWFMRISHKEKLSFVLKLLNIFSEVLKRSTNLLIDVLGPVSKDFIYAKTQFTLSKYDMTPLDNSRCLSDIPLSEAMTNSVSWFSELEEKEQVRVMIILLNLSGSAITFHFYFKAIKYLDHGGICDSSVIEEKLNNYKFYIKMMDKEELTDNPINDFKSDVSLESPVSHISEVNSVTKNLDTTKNASVDSSVSSKNGMTALDYELKLEEWEKEFTELINLSGGLLKEGNSKENVLPVIDMLQLLPISVNRYMYTFLDQRSKKHLRHINKYWHKSSFTIHKEEHARHSLNQTIKMLDLKLFKYKTKDLYSDVIYAHPTLDNDLPQSDQDNKSKSSKHGSSQSVEEIRGSQSLPSLSDLALFDPEYNIKMIPALDLQYTHKYPKNPYKGSYTISEICRRFDHTRCIAANYQWIAMSDKSNITLHSLLTGAPNPCQLKGHTGYVTVLCFHPSKTCLFSGSIDTTIKYWDLFSRNIIVTYTGHKSLITDIRVNENYLASISMDHTLRIFNIESGSQIWQYLFSCCPLVINLGWNLDVYLGFEDGTVFKIDFESTPIPAEEEINQALGDKITCILFDEPFVITGGEDGYVRVWHFEHFGVSALAIFNHNGLCITGVALSFMKVLTTAFDGILRIWDIYNSRLKRQIIVNIGRTPILSMICLEITDHSKVIINSEDSIKVLEFSYYWVNYKRSCLIKGDKEPKFVRGLKRVTTMAPDNVLAAQLQLRMVQKLRFEERCREQLQLRQAALPVIVKPSKGDKVTLKEVPIFSKALCDKDLLLFPRIMPGTSKMTPYTVKNDVIESGNKILDALWKYLPKSRKGMLPVYNPSKRTM